ncbi:FAD/NAD(P)-binding domain-containing protein [Glonium stellatum]|uniref:FAD/NAD(P)-binding domain-containing protein n=1 Tax=Glonium stellatum TaxID=574774 RepID=A0A8E2JX08_9PEZI|nr:FAD/NAD(P)-binding domain-containing protein [Glonium stellatum]
MLSQQGIQVQVLEGEDKLDNQPRACHYSAPACFELARAKVLEKIKAEGFFPGSVCWRKKDGSRIVGLSNTDTPEDSPYRMVCLPLGRVIEIISEELLKQGTSELLMGHKVIGLGQTNSLAWVNVLTSSGDSQKLEADYIVGCDGANSQIRRSLFGDWEFPGWTWDKQIVASNVYYDFEKFGYEDANFIVHPKDWYMAAKITRDGMWRVTYGDVPDLTREQYLERLPMRFKEMLPGQPEPIDFKLVNIGPYKMHQRIAKSLRSRRFLLAGDAAHLCNPFGGLGLTGGIADVGGLYDSLVGIHRGQADDSILDKYSEVRRERYQNFVDPISTENFRRLWSEDPEKIIETDEFFMLARRMAIDKEFSQEFQLGAMALQHDFTQYYKVADGERNGIKEKTVTAK